VKVPRAAGFKNEQKVKEKNKSMASVTFQPLKTLVLDFYFDLVAFARACLGFFCLNFVLTLPKKKNVSIFFFLNISLCASLRSWT
jgi:hypothetical protein